MNELLSFHAIQRDRAAQCRNVPDWIRAESLSRTFIPAKKGEEKQHSLQTTLEELSEAEAFTTTDALGALVRIWMAWTALPTKTEDEAERAAILRRRGKGFGGVMCANMSASRRSKQIL